MTVKESIELASINRAIQEESPYTYELLSPLGRQYFFSKQGILSQSAEAKDRAKKFNATVGIATDGKNPLSLNAINEIFPAIPPAKAHPYCPPFGVPELREIWKQRMQRLSPSIPASAFQTSISTPVITIGMSYGISICANLFFSASDTLILTDPHWENYLSIFGSRGVESFRQFRAFSKDRLFNIDGLDDCLQQHFQTEQSAKMILNFPNNPSGYSITTKQAFELKGLLVSYANKGKNILVICDDAYFGLFYEQDVYPESMFSLLSQAHERITAIKLDGVTKEYFTWGMRVGFITFGSTGLTTTSIKMLENKCAGVIRSDISTCSTITQNILVKAFSNPMLEEQASTLVQTLKERFLEVKKVLANEVYLQEFEPYPFNSGYFMLIKLKRCDAEQLRQHLLEKYQIGLISIGVSDIRIAFSCVPKESIQELFDTIYKACTDL